MKAFYLAALLLLWPLPGPAAPPSSEMRRWPDGPVRYLLSYQEDRQFRSLEDDHARALFIVRFWQRFDPTPGTLENEVRREFWRRVVEANRRFRETVRPGWLTDRGRIFILFGEPDDVTVAEDTGFRSIPTSPLSGLGRTGPQDAGSDAGRVGEDTAQRGLLRWLYRNLPGKSTDPEMIISFTRDASGEWRVSLNPDYYSPAFPDFSSVNMIPIGSPTLGLGQPQANPSAALSSTRRINLELLERMVHARSLSDAGRREILALDLGEASRLPSTAQVGAEIVTATEFLDRFKVTPRLAFFKTSDGGTLVRVGTSVAANEVYGDGGVLTELTSFLLLYARFSPASGEADIFASNESSPKPVMASDILGPDALLEGWTAVIVPPGAYQVALGIQDAATGEASSLRLNVDVPDFASGSPAISSLLPASRIDQVAGRVRPEPKVAALFHRDEEFGVYFEIYNLVKVDGIGLFDLTYHFYVRDGVPRRPIGVPVAFRGLTEPVQGWSFPLMGLPPGLYSLEAVVDDLRGGGRASGALDFEVR